MTRRVGVVLACLLAWTTAIPTVAHAGVAADPRLPLSGFGAILVDQAHGHVFLSGGPSARAVLVTDLRGRLVGRIDDEPGAAGLALSADARTLYAALSTGDAIAAIDTASLAETARYRTPAGTCPSSLTRTGGYLWFGYGCPDGEQSGLGRVDTTSAPVGVRLDQADTQFHGAPLVASGPAEAGPLVVAQPHASASMTVVYAVRQGVLDPGASGVMGGGDLADLALSPDTALVCTAAASRTRVEAFATADLSQRGAYPLDHAAAAVALSPDGRLLAAATSASTRQVWLFRLGASTPDRVFDLAGETVPAGGLAWTSDARTLFAVTQRSPDAAPSLHVLPG
jgi:hypothetical protein